jgi:putative transposase
MVSRSRAIRHLVPCAVMLCTLLLDAARFLRCCLRSPAALAAENLFLRKQLALYQERHVKPRRATDAIRVALVWLSQWFDWPQALTVVPPETFSRWRRQRLRLFWREPLCPGRPPMPVELQALIRQMSRDNLTWGQRRIANELRLKLGLQVSPRTVCKYMSTRFDRAPGQRVPSQRWRTFVRNHAWDLIVRGVSVDFIRGAHALSIRLIQFLQR